MSTDLTLIQHHQAERITAYLSGRLYYTNERSVTPTRPVTITHGPFNACLTVTPHRRGQGTPSDIAAYAYAISDAMQDHPGARRRDLTLHADPAAPDTLTAQFIPAGVIIPARHDVLHTTPLPGGHLIITLRPLRAPGILSATLT